MRATSLKATSNVVYLVPALHTAPPRARAQSPHLLSGSPRSTAMMDSILVVTIPLYFTLANNKWRHMTGLENVGRHGIRGGKVQRLSDGNCKRERHGCHEPKPKDSFANCDALIRAYTVLPL